MFSGKGEFGEVFLAKAHRIEEGEEQTVVLVKSLQCRDELPQAEFRRQAEMFGKLNHINIVRLLGLCRDAEPHYMVLEYVDLVKDAPHIKCIQFIHTVFTYNGFCQMHIWGFACSPHVCVGSWFGHFDTFLFFRVILNSS